MTIRMGFHRHTGKRDDMFKAYVDKVRPQFVKFLDGFPQDLADYCHARGTRVIGRVYFQTQKLGAEGSRQMKQVVQTAREKPWVDYWELHNEDWQHGAEMERYAELCIEFMGELDVIGKKAAIGCFSTGQPEVREWVRFLPALKYAAAHGHAWACHEYGGGPPGAKWGVGRNQWNNGQPVTDDPCDDPNVRYLGWWCLRYRRAVDEMKRLGMVKIPDLLITEALIDDIQPRPGNVGKGYKDFKGQHPPNVGDYADQWAWYCRELSKDPFVIGAVDFGWATADPTWNSFDVSTDPVTFDRLIQTMTALPNTTPTPAPQPQPETPPMDALSAILRRELGNRFSDDRAIMPRHASAKYSPLNPAAYKGIAVHHSASARGTAPASIADYHVTHNGWAGVGYHIIIRQGVAHYVGDIATQRAHVAGRNHELAGVCVTGDYTKEAPRTEDLDTLRLVIKALDELLGKALPINGHGGWALAGHKTECPGALVGPAREIRSGGGAPDVVNYGKIVWAMEEATRILEREGRSIDASYIKSIILPPLVKMRDA